MVIKISTIMKNRNRFFISFLALNYVNDLLRLGSVFMTSYILFLGLEEWQIGMIASVMGLTGIIRILVPYVFERFKSRKKAIVIFKVLQYIVIYILVIVPKIQSGQLKLISLILALFIYYSINAVNDIGLLEWNNKFVPSEIKGEYFSTRNLLFNFIGMTAPFALGYILDSRGGTYTTYFIILLSYMIFMIIDIVNTCYLKDMPEAPEKAKTESFLKKLSIVLKDKRYMQFIYFDIFWTFAIFFGNAYYSYYAVKYQGLSLGFIGLVGSGTAFMKMFVARKCGRKVDEIGWEKILYRAGIGFGLTNILWILVGFNPQIMYPLIIFMKGFFMITFNIAKFRANLMLGKDEHRMFYLAVNGCFLGMANFISSNIVSGLLKSGGGGGLKSLATYLSLDYYLVIFMISGLLNLLAILYFYAFKKKSNCDIMNEKQLKKESCIQSR